jgi:MFS family permease
MKLSFMNSEELFTQKDLAYTIGGDTFGVLAQFVQSHGHYYESSVGDTFAPPVQIPNPFFTVLDSAVNALSTSPASYLNGWAFLTIALPLVLIFFLSGKFFKGDRERSYLALIVAVSVAFSAFNLWHFLAGHLGFNLVFLLLWLWTHYRLCERPSIKNAFIAGGVLGISAVFNPYFGFFSGLLAVFSVLILALQNRQATGSLIRWNLISWFIAISVTAIAFFPILDALLNAHQQPGGSAFNRDPGSVWGVLPWMYLLPTPYHLFATESYREFYLKAMSVGNVPEVALYLGIFNIVFFQYGSYLYFTGKLEGPLRKAFFLAAVLALFCFVLSMPPYVSLPGERTLYLPGHYLHTFFTMFRIYSRFGVLVLVFTTIGAIIAFRYLLQAYPKHAQRIAMCGLLLVVVDLFPRLPTIDLARYPAVYDWLKAQPGMFAVYELPEDHSISGKDDFQHYKRNFYQMIHGKRVINRTIGKVDVYSRDFYATLKKHGVKYLVQHESMYQEGPLPKEYKPYVTRNVAEEKFNDGVPETLPDWYFPLARIGTAVVYRLE